MTIISKLNSIFITKVSKRAITCIYIDKCTLHWWLKIRKVSQTEFFLL